MAIQGPIPVEFGAVFPDGAYAAGKFEMVRDFDRSSGDRVVQQMDKVTGLPLWVVEVIDADEAARQRTVKVKVAAQVQPVLPSPAAGSPFTAVEFEGLTATPYVDASRCQGNGQGQVRRPAGVLAEGHRGPCPLARVSAARRPNRGRTRRDGPAEPGGASVPAGRLAGMRWRSCRSRPARRCSLSAPGPR